MSRENPNDFLYKKFGKITVAEDLGTINKYRIVTGVCECGLIKEYKLTLLKRGQTTSCGCVKTQMLIDRNTVHNLCYHPLHKVWTGMKSRCYNKNVESYERYGGRGVTVCDEWKNNFKTFYDWAINNGWAIGLELDKDKLSPGKIGICYCPQYCCFLTSKENNRNTKRSRSIEYNGDIKTLAEWMEILKLSYHTIKARLNDGWGIKKSFETKIRSCIRQTKV